MHQRLSKKYSYVNYWDENDLYGWAISQKLIVNDFKWVDNISEFDESFIKLYSEENDEGYFPEVDIQYQYFPILLQGFIIFP